MRYQYTNKDNGQLLLCKNEVCFDHQYFLQKKGVSLYSIAWNTGKRQTIWIDEVAFSFEENTMLPLMLNQSFKFENSEHIVTWQFSPEFYCIVNHDAEVGCVGFVFYGFSPTMFVTLTEDDQLMIKKLLEVFEEEFNSEEDIKGEMLRMLLVRLIIKITRLAKAQYQSDKTIEDDKFNLIRQFNLEVERHFRKEHQVQFYAGLLNKSPKTISNVFSLYSKKTPTQIIQERIIREAKRFFYYTDKSVKEIANELGFAEVAHFSKFFKNCTSITPSELKKAI